MPISPRRAVRRVLLVAVAVLATAVWCAPASADSDFTIVLPDGTERGVTLSDLGRPDVGPGTNYAVRSRPGSTGTTVKVTGYSLAKVFDYLGAGDGFKHVRIGSGLGEITLNANQLDDVRPPVVYLQGDSVRFLRNSYGENDVNSRHWLTLPTGPTDQERADWEAHRTPDTEPRWRWLKIVQDAKGSLRLSPSVSKRKADAGDELTFDVTHGGGGAGKRLTYEWRFGDGKTATGSTPSHAYEKAGNYDALVIAKAPDEEEGLVEEGRAYVRGIAIGKAKESDEERGGGGGNDAPGAPPTGPYGGPSGAGDPYGDSSTSTDTTPTPDFDFDGVTTDKDPPAFGNTVEGTLLASTSTTPDDATASAARAARTGNPDFEVPEADDDVPPAAWAGLGALMLIGAGAGLESGRRPRMRRPALRLGLPRR